jgi:ribosomal protein L11 methyltransferase
MAQPPSELTDAARDLISRSPRRLTPEQICRHLVDAFGVGRRTALRSLNTLVQGGDVQYTYEFGCSFVVPSFNRPVAVSDRIILAPQGVTPAPEAGQVVVYLRHGAAFGTGAHPTTRLAIRGIEAIAERVTGRVLDIGTGSGVLLLAALALGMEKGIGLDLDPCAVAEATANAGINGVADRARFADRDWSRMAGTFGLVTANLRFPTLCDLAGAITSRLNPGGLLVVSGLREEEEGALDQRFRARGWKSIWQETDTGWAGRVFTRRS